MFDINATEPKPMIQTFSSQNLADFQTLTVSDGLPSNQIRCLYTYHNRVYAGFNDCYQSSIQQTLGWFDWRFPKFWNQCTNPAQMLKIYTMTITDDGDLWIYGSKPDPNGGRCLFHVQNGIVNEYFLKELPKSPSPFKGSKGEFVSNPKSNSNIFGSHVYSLFADGDILWIGTDNGITRLHTQTMQCQHSSTQDGLPGYEIFCLAKDSAGILWAGTSKGVASYDGKQWHHHLDYGQDMILSMTEDSNENMWFGTCRMGVFYKKRDTIKQFTPWNSALRHSMITCMSASLEGSIWLGTLEGLTCFAPNESSWTYTQDNSNLPSNRILSLTHDWNQNLWIGTNQGICSLEKNPAPHSVAVNVK